MINGTLIGSINWVICKLLIFGVHLLCKIIVDLLCCIMNEQKLLFECAYI